MCIRPQMNEAYPNKWEVVNITHVEMGKDEEDERREAMAEVLDPMYMLHGEADADVEGEGVVEVDEKPEDDMVMDLEGDGGGGTAVDALVS
jgi:hypothetical protein